MILRYLITLIFCLSCNVLFAQYFYNSILSPGQNPGGLNTDDEVPLGGGLAAGWSTVLAGGNTTGTYSTARTIPFSFDFDGSAYTQYKVSNSGILTFDISTSLVTGSSNTSLPSALVPDKAVCVWGISGPGANDNILSKTFGSSPNRQHWIFFSSYDFNGNWSYWSIVLEETSNKIYIVDQRHQNSVTGVTLGIQFNSTTAIQVTGSPNISTVAGGNAAPLDNAYYEFTQGIPLQYDFGVDDIEIDAFPNMLSAPFELQGELTNFGTMSITSFTLNYSIDGTAPVTNAISSVSIPSGSAYNYTHNVDWNPILSGVYSVKVWATNLNGNTDQFNGNDTAEVDVIVSDSIPNIIDNYLNGTPVSTVIGTAADQLDVPRDLEFHPDFIRSELWVINKKIESSGGSTVTYFNAGTPNQTDQHKQDGNAWHFMSLPSGLAFSENGNWANSPGVFDANHNGGAPFTGPALWSSDPAIYAQPSGGNGSHLDMLHESPYSMGIENEVDNVFWIFDSHNNDIVRYDFVEDHGPGNSYHADAIVRRYPVPVSRINLDIPCHLALDKKTNWLYIVDGGSQRVLRLNINSGSPAGTPTAPQYEALSEYTQMSNITWEIVVDSGLVQPSGIDVVDNRMIISDHSNGDIIVYDISVNPVLELGRISTGSIGIQGLTIGPEGDIWFVNATTNQVIQLQSATVSVNEIESKNDLTIFPVPSFGSISIESEQFLLKGKVLKIVDMLGKTVYQINDIKQDRLDIELSEFGTGIYSVHVTDEETIYLNKKIIIQN